MQVTGSLSAKGRCSHAMPAQMCPATPLLP